MDELRAFVRRGRGVSFHEFHVALGPLHDLELVSCLQTERRSRSLLRRVGFAASRAGRYERFLGRVSDGVPRAFLQPFLYLTIRKG